MLSFSDLIAILDKIPIWKTIKVLPEKFQDLEKRVEALEAKKQTRLTCLQCGSSNYKIEDTRTSRGDGKLMHTVSYTCQSCNYKGMEDVDSV